MNQLASLDVTMAASFLDHQRSVNHSPSTLSGLQSNNQASLKQAVLPKIVPQVFEKHNSPLTLVKPSLQFMSPHSIAELSNLSKVVSEAKRQQQFEDEIPRMKDALK
jgi:hypothetical protein